MIISTYTNVSARFSGNSNCFSSRLAQQSTAIKLSSLVDSWYMCAQNSNRATMGNVSKFNLLCGYCMPILFILLFTSLCDPSVAVQTDNEISDACF